MVACSGACLSPSTRRRLVRYCTEAVIHPDSPALHEARAAAFRLYGERHGHGHPRRDEQAHRAEPVDHPASSWSARCGDLPAPSAALPAPLLSASRPSIGAGGERYQASPRKMCCSTNTDHLRRCVAKQRRLCGLTTIPITMAAASLSSGPHNQSETAFVHTLGAGGVLIPMRPDGLQRIYRRGRAAGRVAARQ